MDASEAAQRLEEADKRKSAASVAIRADAPISLALSAEKIADAGWQNY